MPIRLNTNAGPSVINLLIACYSPLSVTARDLIFINSPIRRVKGPEDGPCGPYVPEVPGPYVPEVPGPYVPEVPGP